MIAYILAFAARLQEAGAHEEAPKGLLEVNPGLAFWTVLTFIILLLILRKVAWRPILTALDEREKQIQDALELADKARKEASEKLEANKVIIAQAQDEARKIIGESRKFAEDIKTKMIDESKLAAEKIIEDATLRIDEKTKEAAQNLKNFTVELSIELAEKIIKKNLDGETQKTLVNDYLKAIEKN